MNTDTLSPPTATENRILVVDDQYPVRLLIQRVLAQSGYTVDETPSGREALALMEQHTYAVLITDLKMPDMSGLEILEAAKQLSPTTEVIVITAHGTVESAIAAMREGAYDYLAKPVEMKALLHSVEQTLQYRRLKHEKSTLIADLETQSTQLKRMLSVSNQLAHITFTDHLPLAEIVAVIADTLQLKIAITVFEHPDSAPRHVFSAETAPVWKERISRQVTDIAALEALLACTDTANKVHLIPPDCFPDTDAVAPPEEVPPQIIAIGLDVHPTPTAAVLWICHESQTAAELQRWELLANQLSATLKNAGLALAQHRQINVRNALVQAGQHISTVLNQQDVLLTILQATRQVLPHTEQIGIYYYEERTAELHFLGLDEAQNSLSTPPIPTEQVDKVLQARQDAPDMSITLNGEPHTLILEPLVASTITLGALAVLAKKPRAIAEPYRQALPMLTNQAAIALQNARLYEEARRLDELGALVEAGQAINRTLNLRETLQTTLMVTRNLTNALASFIYLFTPDHRRIDSVITLGHETKLSDADRRESSRLAWDVFRTNDTAQIHTDTPDAHAIQSWLAVPLATGSAPIGALVLGSERRHSFTADDPRLIQVIAAQAATAIENARLYEEVERRLQQTHVLDTITRSISTTLNLPAVLKLIVQSAVKTIPTATNSAVYLHGANQTLTLEAEAAEQPQLPVEIHRVRELIAEESISTLQPVRRQWHSTAEASATWTFLAVPLQVREATIGAITVESPHPTGFMAGDESLLHTFASHASVAIQNANLFQELTSAYIDLKHHQDELLKNNQTLQALFNGITDGLHIVDRSLKIIAINQAEAIRVGGQPEDFIGTKGGSHIWGDATPAIAQIVRDTIARKKGVLWGSGEAAYQQITPPNRGPYAERDVRTYPIIGADDTVQQVIIFAQDVSEKHRLQATLFRSANLAAVGQLASSIAHEINNPLTVIIANSQILQMEAAPDDPDSSLVDYILDAGMRIQHIVQNLLDFSTQESYEWAEVDVESTVDDALTLIAAPLRKGKITVRKDFPTLSTIIASANHLQLIWMNLLQNARESIAQSDREGLIEISARQATPETVEITIADNGVGIAKEHLERLFHPFFTTKPPGQGPGLGLYTCRTIVQHHHGSIDVRNKKEGDGAIATVTLPIDSSPANETSAISSPVAEIP